MTSVNAGLLPFPSDITNATQWEEYIKTNNMHPCDLLAYMSKLYQRELTLSTRYHQVFVALIQLEPQHEGTLTSMAACAECNQSVVVDATENGHFLACGHMMHSFCMATFCANNDVAPGCPKCGVRFYPPDVSTIAQIQYSELLTAVRILQPNADVSDVVKQLAQDYIDNNNIINPATPLLERLIMTTPDDIQAITAEATTVITRERARLKSVASTLVTKLAPTMQEFIPFPPLPEARAHNTYDATSNPHAASNNVGAEAAPKRVAATSAGSMPPMPPSLEPDVLPPDGADSFGTGADKQIKSRFNNTMVMFTKFAGQCKGCRRSQTPGRTIIASAGHEKGFLCTMCVFGKTSAQVYNAIVGIDVSNMF